MKHTAGTTTSVEKNRKRDNKLILFTVVIAIIAVCGMAFGVCEAIDNNSKAQQISDLQEQIVQLNRHYSSDLVDYSKKLIIDSSAWSDCMGAFDPQPTREEYEIRLDEEYIIKTRPYTTIEDGEEKEYQEEVFSFEILEVNQDSIKILTFQPFSDSEDGIDLTTDKREFIVKLNEPITLTTPTMDGGDRFTLSLSCGCQVDY